MPAENKSSKTIFVVAVAALIVVVLLIAGMFVFKQKAVGDGSIKKDQYQAVFLTNGQVYFGKLKNVGQQYVEISDIYYLQVQQSVQPADQNKEAQVSLAKLGDELHGPEDNMNISRDQVLFWENLKDDSKVVQAIKDHKK